MKAPTRQERRWFNITAMVKGRRFLGGRSIEGKIAAHTLPKKRPRIQ
jgi:hypothetical protein